ncbi:MAG: hypothetical protein M3N53_03485 [Actinomycetota bacterium]|nr:hypothetical protein [Actinomycetota bacterium]
MTPGRQLSFYKLQGKDLEEAKEEIFDERRRRAAERFIWREGDIRWIVPPGSLQQKANRKYGPLRELLTAQTGTVVHVTFAQLEDRLGQQLPESARNHRAWWANTPSNYHAKAWLDPAWRVDDLDLTAERVTFRKLR